MAKTDAKEAFSSHGGIIPVALEQDPPIIPTQIEGSELNFLYQMDGVLWDKGSLKMFRRRALLVRSGFEHALKESTHYPLLLRPLNTNSTELSGPIDLLLPPAQIKPLAVRVKNGYVNLFIFYREKSIRLAEYDLIVRRTLELANERQIGTKWDQFPTNLREIKEVIPLNEAIS